MKFQLLRALKLGVVLACAGSALVLGGLSFSTAKVSCEGLLGPECEVETSAAADLARLQRLSALGLGLVALGLAVGLGRRGGRE